MIRCRCARAADLRCFTCNGFACAACAASGSCPRCEHPYLLADADAVLLARLAHTAETGVGAHGEPFQAYVDALRVARQAGFPMQTLHHFTRRASDVTRARRILRDEIALAARPSPATILDAAL